MIDPYRFGSGPVIRSPAQGQITLSGLLALPVEIGDPYQDFVSLLLHFEGSNGSTTYTDSSVYAHTPATNSGSALSTTQKKFGSTSLDTAVGGSATLGYATAPELVMGTSDFTAEGWFYFTALSATGNALFGQENGTGTSGRWFVGIHNTISTQIAFYFNGSRVATSSPVLATGQWFHIAYVRIGTAGTCYIDGAVAFTYTDANNYSAAIQFRVPTTNTLTGFMDEFRLTKGVGRYTTTFTPQPLAFANPQSKRIAVPVGAITVTGQTPTRVP